MSQVVNGHPVPDVSGRAAMLARIEKALSAMAVALTASGFSADEAAGINFSTRFAITDMLKERMRKQRHG